MKQFLASLAANFVTIAILIVGFFVIAIGIAASLSSSGPPDVPQGAVLVVDLDEPLEDGPAETVRRSAIDDALSGGEGGVPIRTALLAIREAADDKRISSMLLRGSVGSTGYAALRELRAAIDDFRTRGRKPVHAFLVEPETRDYYVASTASTITIDPFGSLMVPGISAEAIFLSGFLEKYGVGVQVTRVGRFKAAVEPLTRTNMSPENRLQTERYVGALWSEVKRAIATSRGIDTTALQQLVDEHGIIAPDIAKNAKLVDRIAYWDVVLDDLRAAATGAGDSTKGADTADAAQRPVPQIRLGDYAIITNSRTASFGSEQKVALVYATGDIVGGEGGAGMIGGDALARDLRRIRHDRDVKAVVLRVNSPGGSAVASETMQRELSLLAQKVPVVVSMGSVAASGGYWISTAATRIFAQPNTITGSIGVFGLVPNVKTLANRHGVTFDTVKTGKYADLFSISRPRTAGELAVIQRSVDAVYDAFITRVANARRLTPDSVRTIAEGRVWSGEDAVRIGLVDSIGGLDEAVKSAASLAKITGDYRLDEYPKRKDAPELLAELLGRRETPLAGRVASGIAVTNTPAGVLVHDLLGELEALLAFSDPRSSYARLEYILNVR